MGSVEEATERQLGRLPADLRDSAEAAAALALARELDGHNSATSKSMCAKVHSEILQSLRLMAPPEETSDSVDEIRAQRAKREARFAKATD